MLFTFAEILYNIFLYMQIAEVMYNPTSIFIHIFSISLVPSQISSSSSYFWNTFYNMFFISLAIYANREKHHWITYSLVNLQGQYGLDLILWSARTVIPSSIQYWLCKWLNIGESIIWKHWFSIVNSNKLVAITMHCEWMLVLSWQIVVSAQRCVDRECHVPRTMPLTQRLGEDWNCHLVFGPRTISWPLCKGPT